MCAYMHVSQVRSGHGCLTNLDNQLDKKKK